MITREELINKTNGGEKVYFESFASFAELFPEGDITASVPLRITLFESIEVSRLSVTIEESAIIELSCTFSSTNNLSVGNYGHVCKNPTIDFNSQNLFSETEEISYTISGTLSFEEIEYDLPVTIVKNTDISELTVNFKDENNVHGIEMSISQFEKICSDISIQSLPESISISDPIIVSYIKMELCSQFVAITEIKSEILIGQWYIKGLEITLENSMGTFVYAAPFDEASLPEEIYLQGSFLIDEVLVLLEMHFPVAEENSFGPQLMLASDKITLPSLSSVNQFLIGKNAQESMPDALKNMPVLFFSELYCDFNSSITAIDALSLTIITSDTFAWSLVPDVLVLNNISLKFDIPSWKVSVYGIITLKTVDIPVVVTFSMNDTSQITLSIDYSKMEEIILMNYENSGTIEELPSGLAVSLNDLSSLGVQLDSLLPDIPVQLLLNRLTIMIAKETDSYVMKSCSLECTIDQQKADDSSWYITSDVLLEEFLINLEMVKTTEGDFSKKCMIIGNCLLKKSTVKFPVVLIVPDEGDWSIVCQSEEGIPLPGIDTLSDLSGVDVKSRIPDSVPLNDMRLTEFSVLLYFNDKPGLSAMALGITIPESFEIFPGFSIFETCIVTDVQFNENEIVASLLFNADLSIGAITIPVLISYSGDEIKIEISSEDKVFISQDIADFFSEIDSLVGSELKTITGNFFNKSIIMLFHYDFSLTFNLQQNQITAFDISIDFDSSISFDLNVYSLQIRSLLYSYSIRENSAVSFICKLSGTILFPGKREEIVTVEYNNTQWTLTIENNLNVTFGSLTDWIPGIHIPEGLKSFGIAAQSFTITCDSSLQFIEAALYVDIINIVNPPGIEFFKSQVPLKIFIDNKNEISIQLLDWPLVVPKIIPLKEEGWFLLRFKSFGDIKLQLPFFSLDGTRYIIRGKIGFFEKNEEVITAANEAYKSTGLIVPVKTFLQSMGLTFLSDHMTDIPLSEHIPLGAYIASQGGNPDNLPERFQPYLTLVIPDHYDYEAIIQEGVFSMQVTISSEGNMDEELKILYPMGTNLVGLRFRGFGVKMFRGQTFFEVDGDIDAFPIATVVALSQMNVKSFPPLPNFKDMHFYMSFDKLVFFMSLGIPIPTFFDRLTFSYKGIEGFEAQTTWSFPMPGIGLNEILGVVTLVNQLWDYFTHYEYMLKQADLGSLDISLTIKDTYVKFHLISDEIIIGKKGTLLSVSAVSTFVSMLNTLKKPSLHSFMPFIPSEFRFLRKDISVVPFGTIDLALGMTSFQEFKKLSSINSGLPTRILNNVVPKLDEGMLLLLAGELYIPSILKCETVQGVVLKGLEGAHWSNMFYANIGNGFVELDVKSELQINLKNDQSLVVIDATGSITILGLKCFQLSAYYKKNSINFEGNCTIIDWSCFDVSGHLKGSLSPNGTFLLTGTGSINFLGYEFSGCDFLIANSIMSLSTTWLGQSLRFLTSVKNDSLVLDGFAEIESFRLKKTLDDFQLFSGANIISATKLTIDCRVSSSLQVAVNRTSITAKVEVEFHYIRNVELSIHLNELPADFTALKEIITAEIIDYIKHNLLSFPEDAFDNFLRLLEKGLLFVEEVCKILYKTFEKTYEEIAEILKNNLQKDINFITENLIDLIKDGRIVTQLLYFCCKFDEKMIAQSLYSFSISLDYIAVCLHSVIPDYNKIGFALYDGLKLSVDKVASALRHAGASAAQIKSCFELNTIPYDKVSFEEAGFSKDVLNELFGGSGGNGIGDIIGL